jgi:hypothetical protein
VKGMDKKERAPRKQNTDRRDSHGGVQDR